MKRKVAKHMLLSAGLAVNVAFAADKAELKRHAVVTSAHPIAVWEKSAAHASEAITRRSWSHRAPVLSTNWSRSWRACPNRP